MGHVNLWYAQVPTDIFEVIIIYPDIYESRSGDYHKGEFNPGARAVVFAWDYFLKGLEFDNDNINLGLHEFAHVLHLDSVAKSRPGASGVIYSDTFDILLDYLDQPGVKDNIIALGYFRNYAYTNNHEFIAVVLEYFFETPQQFKQQLPQLYAMLSKMINYRKG